MKNNIKEFLKEYNELTNRHSIYVSAGIKKDSFGIEWCFLRLNVEKKNGDILKKIPIRWNNETHEWEKGERNI